MEVHNTLKKTSITHTQYSWNRTITLGIGVDDGGGGGV
jgi:hypothetical protein